MQTERRTLLRTSGIVVAGVMAGCTDGGGDETTEPDGDGSAETDTTTTAESEPTATTEPMETTAAPATESPTATPAGTTVEMKNVSYDPMEVAVEPGTTVRWVNRDGVPHDVDSGQFNDGAADWGLDSDTVSEGGVITYTFEAAGTYEYFCSVHGKDSMCGVVLVGDASRAGPLPCE